MRLDCLTRSGPGFTAPTGCVTSRGNWGAWRPDGTRTRRSISSGRSCTTRRSSSRQLCGAALLVEIAPPSEPVLEFYAQALFCAQRRSDAGARFRGLSLEAADHAHPWLPADRRLREEDMAVLAALDAWLDGAGGGLARLCLDRVPAERPFVAVQLAAAKPAGTAPGICRMRCRCGPTAKAWPRSGRRAPRTRPTAAWPGKSPWPSATASPLWPPSCATTWPRRRRPDLLFAPSIPRETRPWPGRGRAPATRDPGRNPLLLPAQNRQGKRGSLAPGARLG